MSDVGKAAFEYGRTFSMPGNKSPVGFCDDMHRQSYYSFIAGAEWQKERAIEAFRMFVEDYCNESGRKDILKESNHYIEVFTNLIK